MKLSVDIAPPKKPTQRDAAGLTNIPQAELIITPPANVALLISPIENLPLAIALVIKVAIQLPDIDKIVFIMTIPLK